MSTISEVFRRSAGEGWIVLSGGNIEFGEAFPGLTERMLDLLDLSRPPYHIVLGGAPTREILEIIDELEILFGLEVERVENPQDWPDAVQSGGLIVISGEGPSVSARLREAVGPDPPELAAGVLLLIIGFAAGLIGSWQISHDDNGIEPGLSWIQNALILLGEEDPGELADIRRLAKVEPSSFVLGLPKNALIALGPLGQVEVWSAEPPRILLGTGWVGG